MADEIPELSIWKIRTGADFRRVFFLEDPSLPKIPNPNFDPECPEDELLNPKEIFQPLDLTGATARMDMREGPLQSDALIKRLETGGSGITFGSPDPVDGSVEVFIDNTETESGNIFANKGKTAFTDFFLIPAIPSEDRGPIFKMEIPIIETVTKFV